jgi:hypothetical protein
MIGDFNGWDNDANRSNQLDNEKKAKELATQFRLAFHDSEAGRFVLEHLVKTFVKRQIVRPNDTQFEAGIRQGQANIVIDILAQIDYAMKGTK